MATRKTATTRAPRKPTWAKGGISKEIDETTGRHKVTLPSVPGLTSEQRDMLFEFEAGAVGTTRALIRMKKRHVKSLDSTIPNRIARALADLKSADEDQYNVVNGFYA